MEVLVKVIRFALAPVTVQVPETVVVVLAVKSMFLATEEVAVKL